MLKSILAVVAGYATMFVLYFAVFTGVYIALGPERAFKPDSYEISPLWMAISIAVTLGGAVVGGHVCAVISRNKRTCQVFAFIVFLAGILLCLPAMMRDDESPHVRAGEVPNLEAMQLAVTPNWLHLLSPVLGAGGVLLGARMKLSL
jgi:hypothetical protein